MNLVSSMVFNIGYSSRLSIYSEKLAKFTARLLQNTSIKGCKETEEKQSMQAILTACTINLDEHINKNKVCVAIGMSSCSFYQNLPVKRSATQ